MNKLYETICLATFLPWNPAGFGNHGRGSCLGSHSLRDYEIAELAFFLYVYHTMRWNEQSPSAIP